MERKRIPLIPFIVVAVVILIFEKYHSQLPNSFSSSDQLNTTDALSIPCANNYQKSRVFDNNCAPCHLINKDMTGPALQGSLFDEPFYGWFELFITSEDSLEDAKDTTTIKLIKEWSNNTWRHNFDALTKLEMTELRELTQ